MGVKNESKTEGEKRAIRGACVVVSVFLCIYRIHVRVNVSWKNCGYPSILNGNSVLLPQLVRTNLQT